MRAFWIYSLLAAILVVALLAGWWCQRDVGLADSGDFIRVTFPFTSGPVGLRADIPLSDTEEGRQRFFHYWIPRWEPRWFLARPASSVQGLWAPGLLAAAAGVEGGKVDLRVISLFPKLLLLGELLVIIVWAWRQRAFAFTLLITVGVPTVLVFTATDYLAYLQSFYQETASLVFVLPVLFSLAAFRRRPSSARLAATLVWLTLLTTAKSSTFYWPFLVLPFLLSAWLAGNSRLAASRRRVMTMVAVSVVVTLAFTLASIRATRVGGSHANPYHSFFYGALTFSAHPAEHLKRLGLSAEAACIGQDAYSPTGVRFLAAHPGRIGFRDALEVYLREPGAIWAGAAHALANMQDISLEYLGKYARNDPRSALYSSLDRRGREARLWRGDLDGDAWNAWSTGKFWCFPTSGALVICLLAFVAWFAWEFRGPEETGRDLAMVGLLATLACVVEMAVAILGEGRADLIKHLFLANLLFDIAAVAFVVGAAVWLQRQVGQRAKPDAKIAAPGAS